MTLKQVLLRRVECDFDGCDNVAEVTKSDAITARFEAAALGWGYSSRGEGRGHARRYDFCPSHKGGAS